MAQISNNNQNNNTINSKTPIIGIEASIPLLLNNYELAMKSGSKPIILISTGSYNPVHRLHIALFQRVKSILQLEHNITVIGAFISPSHDNYCQSKLGREYNIDHHNCNNRLKMIELAIIDAGLTDWLFIGDWECKQEEFIDYPNVVKAMHELINKLINEHYSNENNGKFGAIDIPCRYLCGLDHVLKVGVHMGKMKNYGVIAVNRPGYKLYTKLPNHIQLISINTSNPNNNNNSTSNTDDSKDSSKDNMLNDIDVSSTLLKQRLKTGKSIDDIEFPSVIKFIQEHKMYGCNKSS